MIGDPADAGTVNTYLGILNTLRPPALGGNPEKGRLYFEKALELTGGRDLSVLVEYARGYARLVYDRELHDAAAEPGSRCRSPRSRATLCSISSRRSRQPNCWLQRTTTSSPPQPIEG